MESESAPREATSVANDAAAVPPPAADQEGGEPGHHPPTAPVSGGKSPAPAVVAGKTAPTDAPPAVAAPLPDNQPAEGTTTNGAPATSATAAGASDETVASPAPQPAADAASTEAAASTNPASGGTAEQVSPANPAPTGAADVQQQPASSDSSAPPQPGPATSVEPSSTADGAAQLQQQDADKPPAVSATHSVSFAPDVDDGPASTGAGVGSSSKPSSGGQTPVNTTSGAPASGGRSPVPAGGGAPAASTDGNQQQQGASSDALPRLRFIELETFYGHGFWLETKRMKEDVWQLKSPEVVVHGTIQRPGDAAAELNKDPKKEQKKPFNVSLGAQAYSTFPSARRPSAIPIEHILVNHNTEAELKAIARQAALQAAIRPMTQAILSGSFADVPALRGVLRSFIDTKKNQGLCISAYPAIDMPYRAAYEFNPSSSSDAPKPAAVQPVLAAAQEAPLVPLLVRVNQTKPEATAVEPLSRTAVQGLVALGTRVVVAMHDFSTEDDQPSWPWRTVISALRAWEGTIENFDLWCLRGDSATDVKVFEVSVVNAHQDHDTYNQIKSGLIRLYGWAQRPTRVSLVGLVATPEPSPEVKPTAAPAAPPALDLRIGQSSGSGGIGAGSPGRRTRASTVSASPTRKADFSSISVPTASGGGKDGGQGSQPTTAAGGGDDAAEVSVGAPKAAANDPPRPSPSAAASGAPAPVTGSAAAPAAAGGDDGASSPEFQNRLVYYMARVEELEAANAVLQASLDGSRQREVALLRSIDGYKSLHADVTAKRDALRADCDGHQRVVASMTDKVSALLNENESLRQQLRRLEEITAVNPAVVGRTASSAFARPEDATGAEEQQRVRGREQPAAWASDPSAMAARIAVLDADVARLQEQLRTRTSALNDALQVVHALSTTGKPEASLAMTVDRNSISAAALYSIQTREHLGAGRAYAASSSSGSGGGGVGVHGGGHVTSAIGTPSSVLLREKAELQVRVKELEDELKTARAQTRAARNAAAAAAVSGGVGHGSHVATARVGTSAIGARHSVADSLRPESTTAGAAGLNVSRFGTGLL